MDFFQYMLIICFVVGAGLVIYSAVNFVPVGSEEAEPAGLDGIEEKIATFGHSIVEADNTINELNDISQNVFKEIDDKYQQLLFLYNLIDEKKSQLYEGEKGKNVPSWEVGDKKAPSWEAGDKNAPPSQVDVVVDESTKKIIRNPRLKKMLEMQRKGMSVSQIAKELGMGKTEAELILRLGRSDAPNA